MSDASPVPAYAAYWRHWRCAVAVWQAGSAARAAPRCFATPSSVARAVQQLEARLQLVLFERRARGMVVTPTGARILPRVARAFAYLAQADHDLQTLRPAGAGLGSSLSLGYRHWQVLLAVAQHGSETLAAKLLGVSQPAVHQALAQLEQSLQCRLFERTARGMRQTAAGSRFERGVRLALAEFRQAQEDHDWQRGLRHARLVIGALPLSSGSLVPHAVEALLRRFPALCITVLDGTYDTLLQGLRRAEVDLIVGALREPPPGPDVRQETWFIDTLAVLARRDHPALQRPRVSLADLVDHAWVTPLPATPARRAFDQAFRAAGCRAPVESLVSNSPAVIRASLLDSDRLALVPPALMARELALGLVQPVAVPVPGTERPIGMTLRVDQQPSAALLALLALLRQSDDGDPARSGQPGRVSGDLHD